MMELIGNVSAFFLNIWFSIIHPYAIQPDLCTTREDVSFCYYKGSTDRVVYYLHGIGNDATAWSWNPVTSIIVKQWEGRSHPHVISVSYGKMWWYTEKLQGEKLLSVVKDFEQEQKINARDHVVYGDSMGGHNSLRLAADFPEYFSKLAVSCPALPVSFVKKLKEHQGDWPYNYFADSILRGRYEQYKLKSPLKETEFLKRDAPIKNIHIMVSTIDNFGFYSGGSELYEDLKAVNPTAVTFEAQNVRHCNVDPKILSEFLLN